MFHRKGAAFGQRPQAGVALHGPRALCQQPIFTTSGDNPLAAGRRRRL